MAVVLALTCSLLFSSSVSAVGGISEGASSSFWIGVGNANNPSNTGYIWSSQWTSSGSTMSTGNLSANGSPNNISFRRDGIIISSNNIDNGNIYFRGYADLKLNVSGSTDTIRGGIGSSYTLFNGNAFDIGLSPSIGVYNGTVNVTSTNCSYTPANLDYSSSASVNCRVDFNGSFPVGSPGNYILNWRINGNAATNGGAGSQWANFVMFGGSNGSFRFNDAGSYIHLEYFSENDENMSNQLLGQITGQNNTIIGQNGQIINGLGDINSSINSSSQAQIDAINEQTQQQEDQYNQEKEEESQREDEMDGQASQAESMFSFTFLNPFIGIFELFNDSGCVSIPTIAGMVGSDETTYCPWFDSSVRNILTPVFGLSSMILIFGFAVRWLGSSGDAVTVNSKTWKDGGY